MIKLEGLLKCSVWGLGLVFRLMILELFRSVAAVLLGGAVFRLHSSRTYVEISLELRSRHDSA